MPSCVDEAEIEPGALLAREGQDAPPSSGEEVDADHGVADAVQREPSVQGKDTSSAVQLAER